MSCFRHVSEDPTDISPHRFLDVKANRDILKKSRESHAAKRDGAAGGSGNGGAGEKDLSSLVASVKAKMESGGPKRKRTRKH